MTVKEITTLRKSGHLQEALDAAEKEFSQSANRYTVGALFWCLNDLYKDQSYGDATKTIERMKSLYNEYCLGDEYMEKALASAKRRSLPHYQEMKDAVENVKNGANAHVVHQQATTWYNEGTLDAQLYQDFGWLIYYALKQTDSQGVQNRKILFNQYLQLDLPRPSILHSLILREAIKLEQDTPPQFRIRDFIQFWDLESLRDDDWVQYRTDEGNTLPSLVEKLIGVYVKELKTDGGKAPEDFSQLVDKALIKFPQNQNLPYFKAIVLISQGKVKEALTYYKHLILQYPSKFYLWNQISELIEDVDTKIGLLCKALTCGANDEYLGSVRLNLASLLSQKDLKGNAKYELEKYRETYHNNGWNLKPEFFHIYNQLASVETATDNSVIYAEYAVNADEFIYSSLPTVVAVKVDEFKVDDRNRPSRKITTWILRAEQNSLKLRKPNKFQLKKNTPNGTIFNVRLHEGKIVWIKEHIGCISEPWIKEVSGEVYLRTDRNGKKFAIISGVYIGENLLKGVSDGQKIMTRSIQQKDGRWSAVSIIKS